MGCGSVQAHRTLTSFPFPSRQSSELFLTSTFSHPNLQFDMPTTRSGQSTSSVHPTPEPDSDSSTSSRRRIGRKEVDRTPVVVHLPDEQLVGLSSCTPHHTFRLLIYSVCSQVESVTPFTNAELTAQDAPDLGLPVVGTVEDYLRLVLQPIALSRPFRLYHDKPSDTPRHFHVYTRLYRHPSQRLKEARNEAQEHTGHDIDTSHTYQQAVKDWHNRSHSATKIMLFCTDHDDAIELNELTLEELAEGASGHMIVVVRIGILNPVIYIFDNAFDPTHPMKPAHLGPNAKVPLSIQGEGYYPLFKFFKLVQDHDKTGSLNGATFFMGGKGLDDGDCALHALGFMREVVMGQQLVTGYRLADPARTEVTTGVLGNPQVCPFGFLNITR